MLPTDFSGASVTQPFLDSSLEIDLGTGIKFYFVLTIFHPLRVNKHLETVEFGDLVGRPTQTSLFVLKRHDSLLLCLCVSLYVILIRLHMLRGPSLDQVYPIVSFWLCSIKYFSSTPWVFVLAILKSRLWMFIDLLQKRQPRKWVTVCILDI